MGAQLQPSQLLTPFNEFLTEFRMALPSHAASTISVIDSILNDTSLSKADRVVEFIDFLELADDVRAFFATHYPDIQSLSGQREAQKKIYQDSIARHPHPAPASPFRATRAVLFTSPLKSAPQTFVPNNAETFESSFS